MVGRYSYLVYMVYKLIDKNVSSSRKKVWQASARSTPHRFNNNFGQILISLGIIHEVPLL